MRNGWNSRVIKGMLINRTDDVLRNLKEIKKVLSRKTEYKMIHDYYCAQFAVLNSAWMNEKCLISRRHMIMGLKSMLDETIDPDRDAVDPGRFQTYWELSTKALIAEFESAIYR